MRLLAVGLVSCLCFGCFVVEEIDQGMEIMEQHSAKTEKSEAEAHSDPSRSKSKSPRRDSERWWSRMRSLAPGTSSEARSDIVRCEIDGAVQYTSESNCRLRGGRAGGR